MATPFPSRAGIILLFLLGLAMVPQSALSCTAIIVGRKASVEGGTLNSHTDDCFDCDFRIARIPRGTHETKHRAVPPMRFTYPRYVGLDRGSTFFPNNTDTSIYPWETSTTVGYVPQVSQSYSYLDGSYAISNEFGVTLGESTCGSKLYAAPLYDGGKALLEVTELGRIALEQAKTAREAITIMGDLAVKYGYFSSEWTGEPADLQAQGGETYTVSDPFETWMMHFSPDETGASAVWVAQRVPDDHISVVTNGYRIREVPREEKRDPNWFLASSNVFSVALSAGLWKGEEADGPLDFKKHYGTELGLYRDPYVSRRAWRVFSHVAPSLKMHGSITTDELPFSVKPDHLVGFEDLKWLFRDHFEGTAYDTTVGLAAGPFGNPNRFDTYGGPADAKSTRKRVSNLYGLHGGENAAFKAKEAHSTDAKADTFPSSRGSDEVDRQSLEYSVVPESFLRREGARGDPEKNDVSMGFPLTDDELSSGHFERTISLFRTAYSHITVVKPTSEDGQARYHFLSQKKLEMKQDFVHKSRIRAREEAFRAASSLLSSSSDVEALLDGYFDFDAPVAGVTTVTSSSSPLSLEDSLFDKTEDQDELDFSPTSTIIAKQTKRGKKTEYDRYLRHPKRYPSTLFFAEEEEDQDQDQDEKVVQRSSKSNSKSNSKSKSKSKSDSEKPVKSSSHEKEVEKEVEKDDEKDEKRIAKKQAQSKARAELKAKEKKEKKERRIELAVSAAREAVSQETSRLSQNLRHTDNTFEKELADALLLARSTSLPREVSYISYISMHQPKTSVYVPFFPAAVPSPQAHLSTGLKANPEGIPAVYSTGSLYAFSQHSLWWVSCAVSNYAQVAWRFMVRDIEAQQGSLESIVASEMQTMWSLLQDSTMSADKTLRASASNPADLANSLTLRLAEKTFDSWWTLLWGLMTRYHDGYRLDEPKAKDYVATPLFYPTWWLKAVRYWRQPREDEGKKVELDAQMYPPPFGACDAPVGWTGLLDGLTLTLSWRLISIFTGLLFLAALFGACVDRCVIRRFCGGHRAQYESVPVYVMRGNGDGDEDEIVYDEGYGSRNKRFSASEAPQSSQETDFLLGRRREGRGSGSINNHSH